MRRLVFFLLLAGLAAFCPLTLMAESTADNVRQGALLYDNWPKLTGASLEGNHPAYPETGKKSGASTWRCKECHGWDYIGRDGRYSKGSHFTGIAGIYDARSKSADEVKAAIAAIGTLHDFSDYLSEEQIEALVLFVNHGQMDIRNAITGEGAGKGSAERGAPLYAAHCGACHGDDGNAIDFKDNKDGLQGVGYLAKDNPQETLHKIRWGHPGSDMPSLLADHGLGDAEAIDLLTYCQSLE